MPLLQSYPCAHDLPYDFIHTFAVLQLQVIGISYYTTDVGIVPAVNEPLSGVADLHEIVWIWCRIAAADCSAEYGQVHKGSQWI